MTATEYCPCCGHELEEHTVNEDGQLFELWYCDGCQADFIPIGFDEWRGLHDCHGTRPITVITTEVDE